MSVRIAVLDPLPVFRRGIVAILGEAGLVAEAPPDALTWTEQHSEPVVFLTLQSQADWQLLTKLHRAHSSPIVVAVLADVSISAYLRALLGGAVAAVPRDASPDRLRQVFEQAVAGMSLVPTDVLRALSTTSVSVEETGDAPTDRELTWLRELSGGITVAQLAKQSGYSERAMFRLLHDLYGRMGARNRTEALIRAHKQGWL